MKKFFVVVALIFMIIYGLFAINFHGSVVKDVGEVYSQTYSRCAETSYGSEGYSWCSKYVHDTQNRIRTLREGRFFNDYSSRAVK